MGLHICYELRLAGDTPDGQVSSLLERLHVRASATASSRVSPMYRLSLNDLQDGRKVSWTGLDSYFYVHASCALEQRDGKAAYDTVDRHRVAALGFAVHPGRGSEAAAFGFVRPLTNSPAADAEQPEDCGKWFWHACCKTQYASAVSDEHLIHCHLTIVDLVEECERMGIDVTVHDETGYWETRSTAHLVSEVDKMNRIVARVAGAFHDALQPEMKVEGAIFEHPDFERLETRGGEDRPDD